MSLPSSADEELIRLRSGVPRRAVTVGDWTAEQRGDELADIAYAGRILLRAIRPVVRDQDWNTVPVRVDAVEPQPEPDGFRTRLTFSDASVEFTGTLQVAVRGDELTVEFAAAASRECRCNRVGLVVLHPPHVAGSHVTVRHSDGRRQDSSWPVVISPHQPFRDVAGFGWTQDGVTAELAFTGDVFETEDQRNWTDASFKTYGTPLDRPFPVRWRLGQQVRQQVILTATAPTAPRAQPRAQPRHQPELRDEDLVIIHDDVDGRVPALSTAAALFPRPASPAGLPPGPVQTVLIELAGDEDHWPELLDAAAAQAGELGAGLDVRMITDRPDVIVRAVGLLPPGVIRVAVFDPAGHITTLPLWDALTSTRDQLPASLDLVAGTRAHFTELNRRFDDLPPDAPSLTFSLTPQMHATEVDHIVDSLSMQRLVAQNAMRLSDGRPLHVGPITLTRRFNAVATSGPSTPEEDARRGVDPLLHTDLAAAWLLGSVSALSVPGVETLCYFETAGPRGLVVDGELTPVGRVFSRLATLRGHEVQRTVAAGDVAALAVRTNGDPDRAETVVVLGNLSNRSRTLRLQHAGAEPQLRLGPWQLVEQRLD